MVPIRAGSFHRGDGSKVSVAAFSILATEITWSHYKTIRDWGENNGYDFEAGIGQANLPAQNVTWYDAVKWCNALSERSGRSPAYFLDKEHQQVYRTGRADLVEANVDWESNGFRLPTEAEWEYAYRAGTSTCFYWGNRARNDPVNHEYAVFHVWGTDEIDGGPLPVASKRANAFGLFDMAGNVEEWVWDRYAIVYEGVSNHNPRGPDTGSLRVLRGGGFVIDRVFTADARHPSYPFHVNCDIGFRIGSSCSETSAPVLAAIDSRPPTPDDIDSFSGRRKVMDVRQDSDAAACARIMPLLDLRQDHLEPVRTAFESQKYGGALTKLRDIWCERLKTSDLEPWLSDQVSLATADRWLEVYRENRPVRWCGPNADIVSPMAFCADEQLARAFATTGSREYADAYLWMTNDAALRAKPIWNRLTKAEKGSGGSPRNSFYGFIGFDAGDPLKPFICIAWMLKHGLPIEEIPPRTLANAFYSAVTDRLAAGLQDDRAAVPNQLWANAATLVEFSHVFPELLDSPLLFAEGISRIRRAMGSVLPDGTDLEASLNYNKRLFEFVRKINGFFPEDAQWPDWLVELNRRCTYRYFMYVALATPFATFPGVGNQQATDSGARELMIQWLDEDNFRGLEAPVSQLLAPDMEVHEPSLTPTFTSVGLPYGGYYVQRSGWAHDDHYLLMRSSRDGIGHDHRDNNSIQLAACGAWLLVDSGAPAYGASFLPDEQKKYLYYFGEEGIGSIFQANGLAVDGLAQGRHHHRLLDSTAGWSTPRKNLLLHSDNFDLAEGIFDGWYESETPISEKNIEGLIADHGAEEVSDIVGYNNQLRINPAREVRAVHRRCVIFVRPERFWIVLDKVAGGQEFTQTWNFPPPASNGEAEPFIRKEDRPGPATRGPGSNGYSPDEVQWDASNKRIVTVSDSRPNIAILHFYTEAVRYQQHFGQMFPMRGWHSFGISGKKVPAVQMESTWKGDLPMLTVLHPIPCPTSSAGPDLGWSSRFQHSCSRQANGFSYVSANASIHCHTTNEPVALSSGPISARASFLLVRESVTDGISGLALNCSQISHDLRNVPEPEYRNFAFTLKNKEWTVLSVISPSTFEWVRGHDGQLTPSYE